MLFSVHFLLAWRGGGSAECQVPREGVRDWKSVVITSNAKQEGRDEDMHEKCGAGHNIAALPHLHCTQSSPCTGPIVVTFRVG